MSLPMMLYLPLVAILMVILFFAARTGLAQVIAGQRSPAAKLGAGFALALAASAVLMFGVDKPWAPWAGVVVAAVVVVPLVLPVTALLVAFGICKLTGKPIRWN